MSNYVKYSDTNRLIWISHITSLLNILYNCGNLLILGLVLQQTYEYSVWFVQSSNGKPFNVKDLFVINTSSDFTEMCKNFCQIRNIITHQPFTLSNRRNKISELLQSSYFRELLEYTFPDTSIFDEMLSSYSRWLYE